MSFSHALRLMRILRTWEKKIPSLSSSESPFTVSLGVHAWAKFRKSHFSWSPTSAFKYSFFPFRALPVTVSCPISFVRITANESKFSKQALILHTKAYSSYCVASLFSPKTLYIDYFKSSLESLETKLQPIQMCKFKVIYKNVHKITVKLFECVYEYWRKHLSLSEAKRQQIYCTFLLSMAHMTVSKVPLAIR